MKLTVKDKIRLNNAIWRTWHIQCKYKFNDYFDQGTALLLQDVSLQQFLKFTELTGLYFGFV